MGRILRLVINRLGVVLLISVVFLSIPQQVLPSTEHTIPLTCPEALTATYPNLNFSTYLGGSGGDCGYGIAVTEDGSCYVTGQTKTSDFPTQNAYDNTLGDTSDVFVTKFVDSPIPSTQLSNVNGFLAFIAVMPIIVLILYKKRK